MGWLNPNLPATDEMGSKMNSPRHLTIVPDSNPFLGAPGNSKLLYWKLYVTNNGLLIPLLISNLDPHHSKPQSFGVTKELTMFGKASET